MLDHLLEEFEAPVGAARAAIQAFDDECRSEVQASNAKKYGFDSSSVSGSGPPESSFLPFHNYAIAPDITSPTT